MSRRGCRLGNGRGRLAACGSRCIDVIGQGADELAAGIAGFGGQRRQDGFDPRNLGNRLDILRTVLGRGDQVGWRFPQLVGLKFGFGKWHFVELVLPLLRPAAGDEGTAGHEFAEDDDADLRRDGDEADGQQKELGVRRGRSVRGSGRLTTRTSGSDELDSVREKASL